MLAGKVKNYDGPKTHHGIIMQIRKDLKAQKKSFSYDLIERVVRLFFGTVGIGYFFRYGNNCNIKMFGYFRVPDRLKSKFKGKKPGTRLYKRRINRMYEAKKRREKRQLERLARNS